MLQRNDDHKETGGNKTYKANFTQKLGQIKLGITRSTGLKNPSLYELYGSSSSHKGSTGIKAEKSETSELYTEINFAKNQEFFNFFIKKLKKK